MIKVMQKYKDLSLPVKASLWYAFANILQKGILFLMLPVYTRLMSTEHYGQYSLFQSWYMILSVIVTLSLYGYLYNNGLLKYENDRDGFSSAMLGLSCLSVLAFAALYLLFKDFFNLVLGLPTAMMLVMFAEFFFTPAYEFWSARKRFDYQYRGPVFISILVAFLTPAVSIPVLYYYHTHFPELEGYANIICRCSVAVCIFSIPFCLIISRSRKFFNKAYWKYALLFILPVIPHLLSATVLQQSNRILIKILCGESKAGIYSVAFTVGMLIIVINTAIVNAFIPWCYKKMKNGNYGKIRQVSNMLVVIIAALHLLLILIGPEIIRIMAAPAYAEAMYLIPPIALCGFFIFLLNLFVTIEYYFSETKYVMGASILSAVLNIILVYWGVKWFGYMAAGYATLFCYIFYSACHHFFLRKVYKTHDIPTGIYDIKFIITISIGAILLCGLALLLYRQLLLRYLFIAGIGLALLLRRKVIFESLRSLKNKSTEAESNEQ